jgi:hypothetical protein
MLFKSQLVTEVSGSVGGLVGSHNIGGMYFRARATPTNPNTPQQQTIRSAVGNLVARWTNILTELQRDIWRFYAFNTPLLNPLGEPINVTGLNMYVRGNTARIQAGEPIADDGPLVFNLGDLTTPSFDADRTADTMNVTFTDTDDWANEDDAAMLVYASRPQNASIVFFKGPYRLAGVIQGDSITPPTSPATIPLPFPLAPGQRLFARIAVSRADGRLSLSFRGLNDG